MLTRAGWLTLVGAAAAAVIGRLFGALELYVLAATAAGLVAAAMVSVHRRTPTPTVRRRLAPARPSVGGAARVELEVQALSRLPVLALVDPVEATVGARATIGPVSAGGTVTVAYRLPTRRRGPVQVGPLAAERSDPFGLAVHRWEVAPAATVTVLPRIEVLSSRPRGGGAARPLEGVSQRALSAAAAEDLATLRPYQLGDDLRRVHWPSSAHADDLLVRRDEERWQGHATVLLDCRRVALDPERFERAVSAAASLVHAMAEAGDRVRLVTTDGLDTAMVDARRAEPVLLAELAVVAQHDATAALAPPPERVGTESLVVLGGADAEALAASAAAFGHRWAFDLDGDDRPFATRWAEQR